MNTAEVNLEPYHNGFLKITDFFSVMVPNNKEGKTEPNLLEIYSKKRKRRASLSVEEEEDSKAKVLHLFYNILNDQLLMEILIRLPHECACRYRAVCKRWCSLLSTSYFITRVIDLNRQRFTAPNTFTLVFHYENPPKENQDESSILFQAISNHPVLYKKKQLDLDFIPRFGMSDDYYAEFTDDKDELDLMRIKDQNIDFIIMGSCNDLLLCSHMDIYRFYVVNLVTRRWVMLPPTGPSDSADIQVTFAGLLCYHDKNDTNSGDGPDGWYRFKVVMFPDNIYHVSNPEINRLRIRIYCSESNQWTEFVVDWYPIAWTPVSYQRKAPILALDGKLHWLNGCSLVSFDPFIDYGQFPKLSHTIKLPDELVHHKPSCFGLCRGHFRVGRRIKDEYRTYFHVWELEDYDKGVWKLAHNVLLNISDKWGDADRYNPIYFMAFHPFDEDVIFVQVRSFVYQLNLRTRRHERYCKLKGFKTGHFDWCKAVPPLLHQWFPTAVPSPPPPAQR